MLKNLECACCGAGFQGWQYFNRDTGYGICRGCEYHYGYHTEGERMEDVKDIYAKDVVQWTAYRHACQEVSPSRQGGEFLPEWVDAYRRIQIKLVAEYKEMKRA